MKYLIQFFISGIFTSLLFPPFFLTPIGFIIFPIIYFFLINKNYENQSSLFHFFSGLIYGIGFFSIYLFWIKEPFFVYEYSKKYSLFSYLLIIYCSLYFGIIFLILKHIKNHITKLLLLPILITVGEIICYNLSFGFPWFSFSIINSNNLFGTSLIFYIGTYGLSYLTIVAFLFPSIFLLKNHNVKKIIFLVYLVLVLLIIFFCIIRSNNLDKKESLINISIVQLNSVLNQNLNNEEKILKYKNILKIIENSNSDLVIFGENEFPTLMNQANIKEIQKNLNSSKKIIIGSSRFENNNFYNTFYLIEKNTYTKFDKKILVPFGEFIPLRRIFNFMEFIAGSSDYTSGKDQRILDIDSNTKIIPVICYEILFFSKLINKKNNKANFIVNLTNDSWFGKVLGPYQHFYFAKLRAAEFNLPIIRVSNNGVSGVIDSFGNVIKYINLNTNQIKTIDVEYTSENKNYLHIHKIFTFLIFIFMIIGFFYNKKNDKL